MAQLDWMESFLSNYTEEIRAISRELRVMVRAAMPRAHEFLFYDAINYSLSSLSVDRICYISPSQKYVTLGFLFGAQLNDPDHLLRGIRKRARHVKVRTAEDARNSALEKLIKAAWAGGADSVARMKHELRRMRQKSSRARRRAALHHRTRRTPRSRLRSRR